MSGTWLAGPSPPSCPNCGGPVDHVVTTTKHLTRAGESVYHASPVYREATDRCRRCGAELSPPPNVHLLER